MIDNNFLEIFKERKELSIRYDKNHEAVWCYFNPQKRACFSMTMLKEIYDVQNKIIKYFEKYKMEPPIPIKYFVLASQVPEIFNFGGDLDLFSWLIKKRDKEMLFEYAKLCIDTVYLNAMGMNLPITTIAFVEGSALGGGFECALSSHVIIAKEEARMGFPEIKFNLFPGMGAYSLLAREGGVKMAEEMIKSGKIYTAKELFSKGVVEKIAKNGIEDVENYMKKHSKVFNGMQGIQRAKRCYQPIDYKELLDIIKIWVETALKITESDIKIMQRFVKAQEQKHQFKMRIRTKQDRRMNLFKPSFPFIDSKGNLVLEDRRKKERRASISNTYKKIAS